MSTGLVPIDVAISTPTSGQFSSDAGQSLDLAPVLSFNAGGGTLVSSPTIEPATSNAQSLFPTENTPSTAVAAPPGTTGTAAAPLLTAPAESAPLQLPQISGTGWLLIAGVALLIILTSGGGKKR